PESEGAARMDEVRNAIETARRRMLIRFSGCLIDLSGARQGAAGFRASVLAVLKNLHTIYKHVSHAHGILMRLGEGCPIRDRCRVEDNDIAEHSFLDEATMIESQIDCRQGA